MNMPLPMALGPLTIHDLERMPDDGRRYELFEGLLIVSPAPFNDHQRATGRLTILLGNACPAEFEVLPGPGVQISETTAFEPDLTVIRAADYTSRYVTKPPVLAVEVRSKSTAQIDLSLKKFAYEQWGITSYWIVAPDPVVPSMAAFELRGGSYVPTAQASDDEPFTVSLPFPFTVTPRQLVADGEWRN